MTDKEPTQDTELYKQFPVKGKYTSAERSEWGLPEPPADKEGEGE